MQGGNIVVAGAGYGGITAALRLARLFRKRPEFRVHLIDRNHFHTLKTQLHEAAVREERVSIPIKRLISGLGIEFLCTELVAIEPASRRIVTTEGPLNFEYLVVALGSQTNFYGIPGLERYGFPLQSLDDAQDIHAHITGLCRDARSEPDPERRREMLRFVIGGGGLSGVEFAAELVEHLDVCLGHDDALRSLSEVIIVEGAAYLIPQMKERLAHRIQERLATKGVQAITGARIESVTAEEVKLSNGKTLRARTVIWTGGIRIPDLVTGSGFKTGPLGRVIVNRYLMAEGMPGVYVIGDSALAVDPSTGAPVAAAAQFALQQGRVVAFNIHADATGGKRKPYKPRVLGEVISLGKHLAVGWLAMPGKGKLTFLGFIGSLIKAAITEKHIVLLRKESRKWTVY